MRNEEIPGSEERTAKSSAESAAAPGQNDKGAWPLFYRKPELLNSATHADWRIKPAGAGFAARTNSVPVMIGEFAAASRHYPVVFAGPEHMPVAVLGLDQRNRFVRDDSWQADTYVPAYVRRYPFVFAEVGEPKGHALAIDAEAPMIVKEGKKGAPLFEDGKPGEITRNALRFCDAFTRESAATREFVGLLVKEDLLVERTANITLSGGSKSALAGFSVVSPEAFSGLAENVVIDWHRKGWLGLVHSHLLSLARFADLLSE